MSVNWTSRTLRSPVSLTPMKPPETAIVPRVASPDATALAGLLTPTQLQDLLTSWSPRTWRAYLYEWRLFKSWCEACRRSTGDADAELVASYLRDTAKNPPPELPRTDGKRRPPPQPRKVAGLERALAAITQFYRLSGRGDLSRNEIVLRAMKAIRRTLRTPQRQAAALRLDDLRKVLDAAPVGIRGDRDRAILLLGFWGGCRRSELAALNLGDVERAAEGVVLHIRESKTNKTGDDEEKVYARAAEAVLCPVRALEAWLVRRGEAADTEPLFVELRGAKRHETRMSDRAIQRLIARYTSTVGLEGRYTGHSLRAGVVTEGAHRGLTDRQIMAVTGHKSAEMVGRYTRKAKRFEGNIVSALLGDADGGPDDED